MSTAARKPANSSRAGNWARSVRRPLAYSYMASNRSVRYGKKRAWKHGSRPSSSSATCAAREFVCNPKGYPGHPWGERADSVLERVKEKNLCNGGSQNWHRKARKTSRERESASARLQRRRPGAAPAGADHHGPGGVLASARLRASQRTRQPSVRQTESARGARVTAADKEECADRREDFSAIASAGCGSSAAARAC